jgi:hypothetical protein
MYRPLKISPTITPSIKRLVQHLDMLLGDVHSMMRLPLQEEGMTHGCNFAAAVVLLELIGGVSSTLFQSTGGSGERYKLVLENYYPWDAEGDTQPAKAARELYKFWRNPLAHELGISGKKGGIGKAGHPEDLLEKLELSPAPPSRTLKFISTENMVHLSVEALYWGTRVMIQRLTEDPKMMKKAEAYLQKKLKI